MSLTKEQDKLRKRRERATMTEAGHEEERRKARERMAALRASWTPEELEAYNAKRRGVYQPARRATRQAPPPRPTVPGVLRELWAKAHPNSAIRRRYRTLKDLERAAQ